jgi:hypothetical protein
VKKRKPLHVYLAGDASTAPHLIGHAYLAEAIYERSHGRYHCRLPQDFDVRGRSPRSLRDLELVQLLECDAAVFNCDGPAPDAGTVAGFMFAKFADLPAVLLRTDLGHGGGRSREPWSPVTGYFPRTVTVRSGSLADYRAANHRHLRLDSTTRLAGQYSTASAQLMCDRIAGQVVRALDRVLRAAPVMPKHLREEVYAWLALMPRLRGRPKELRKQFERYLERKVERDLL